MKKTNDKNNYIDENKRNKKIVECQEKIIKVVPQIKNEVFLSRVLISLTDYLIENPE